MYKKQSIMSNNYNLFRYTLTLLLLTLSFHAGVAANYLCFTAEDAGSKIWIESHANTWTYEESDFIPDISYTTDGGKTWNTMHPNDSITLENVGDKVYPQGSQSLWIFGIRGSSRHSAQHKIQHVRSYRRQWQRDEPD